MTSSGERFTDIELGNKRLPACYGYFGWKLMSLEETMGELRDLVPEINRFVKMAKRHCIFPNDHNLSKDEAASIYLYTMEMLEKASVYHLLNRALRADNRADVRPWFAYLKLFDSATSKLPNFKGVIWRGVDKDVSQTFKKGQRITWWSVSSCSKSVDVISSFIKAAPQSTLFNIECSTGKSIVAYTCYHSENEVILMPGTVFEVAADPLHHHGGLHLIHLKEIFDDDDNDDDDIDDEPKGTTGTTNSRASAVASVSQKMSNISLVVIPNIPANAKWAENGTTVAGGHGRGNELNQLNSPYGIFVSNDQTLYIADKDNDRIVEWKSDATCGQVVAGGNGEGDRVNQLNKPRDVVFDKETDSLIICDSDNGRMIRWYCQKSKSQEVIIQNAPCIGLRMDDQRFLYVTGFDAVRRYNFGEKDGTVVAGGNGKGNELNQVNWPTYVFVDQDYSVYVSDSKNHRVMKWMKNATDGIVVAGGQGEGNALAQLSRPKGVFVDARDTIYVADDGNHRVMRWCKGAKQGSVIIGGNGPGKRANQLQNPEGLSFDCNGNLYVSDYGNNRVQRFSIEI
ncbi:unnamed protein product [Rotaria socialis]|uniref:NAD(P)(+)--arginine ADP-ribosyltransferase n=1 Tax=Rotaria socialis TaxID=392032 RepID=A0A817YZW7_9BILA|nr:unnamed protein product [Rotaria socialis]